jgi:alpha/beta superfamily hydrolase
MAAPAERTLLRGDAGAIEVVASLPAETASAVAVIAHPHPLFGGTMDNKVVTTVARAFLEAGAAVFRFNFRGVGASEGAHAEGRGETDDMVRVIEHARATGGEALPLLLAGFSFGGAVATRASERADFKRLVLVAPGFRRLTAAGLGEKPDFEDAALGSPGRHSYANAVVIHGDVDDTVPLSDSIAWGTVREVPVVVVPGGEHFFHRKLHVLREIVAHWAR